MLQLMSISDIIQKGWKLYTDNIQKFLMPIIIMAAPYVLYYLGMYYGSASIAFLMLILSVVMLIVNLWIAIVIIEIINKLYHNQTVDVNALYESSFKKILSYLLVAILTGLVVLGGMILLIIPGIIFAIWYAFSTYFNILEGKKGVAALKASKELVKGRWGKTFWRLVLPTLAIYVLVMIVVIALTYIISGGRFTAISYNTTMIINAVSSVIFLILAPLFASFSIILYNNLKETKETSAPEAPTAQTQI